MPEAIRSRNQQLGGRMEANEIFELIVDADEKLKYATANQADRRREQARELLERARDAAREIGNDELVQQAELRLSDLSRPPS